MTALTIPLGPADRLAQLYSYPNVPGSDRSLADTVLHWFRQTLQRDGLADLGAQATVRAEGESYFLDLKGPPAVASYFPVYADRLPNLLANGWTALTQVVPKIKADGKWDPEQVGWRFFLPL